MADTPYIPENDQTPFYRLRFERNKLLAKSDWMAGSDVEMSEEWKTYRQALRDLPETHPEPKLDDTNGELINVTWPTRPKLSKWEIKNE